MPNRHILALTLALAGLHTGAALAQEPAQTGTGTGPASTIKAPNTTAVGQTKPPGAAAAPDRTESREARGDAMKRDDKVMKGICIGCGTK
ncbi:hypothetical protein [Methylobacterium gnaphalii]|uniref:Uncharacterized protein n=1 Tax=Methylobacterium gnaphalii TaxID=1010610 RepID=A0A512JHN1_9HYPH|nr:hypothetical protein [Methylobacterium gnaphalii]GEP09469.1 hypothetical protein MGN01_13140 [Methylobacterium gnaphalii]GJD68053.1 hypothetical protein MMMDOFMJ_0971 [Methylobacterium gnaphalii]GLS51584.1 hypothetical protein GCM10007885_44420 [Methylobacterium gnaphalii]